MFAVPIYVTATKQHKSIKNKQCTVTIRILVIYTVIVYAHAVAEIRLIRPNLMTVEFQV